MTEGRTKRIMEYLQGLSILDRRNRETVERVKVFLEEVWAARMWNDTG